MRTFCACLKRIKINLPKPLKFIIIFMNGEQFNHKFEVVKNIEINEVLLGACKANNLDLVKSAIKNGAVKFKKAFFFFFENGNIQIAQLMFEDDTVCRSEGLFRAAKAGHYDFVKFYYDTNEYDLDYTMSGACESNNLELVKYLSEKGADCYDDYLFNACYGGNLEIIDFLIKKGANDFNNGLCGASESGSLEIIKLMIEKGADNFDEGFKIACEIGYLHVVKYLSNTYDCNLDRGLNRANIGNRIEVINYLIKKGAN